MDVNISLLPNRLCIVDCIRAMVPLPTSAVQARYVGIMRSRMKELMWSPRALNSMFLYDEEIISKLVHEKDTLLQTY